MYESAAARADLRVQQLPAVGRKDPLLIDLREVVERERRRLTGPKLPVLKESAILI